MPCIVEVSRGSVITQKRRIVKFLLPENQTGTAAKQSRFL
jgi:hypothetical protein